MLSIELRVAEIKDLKSAKSKYYNNELLNLMTVAELKSKFNCELLNQKKELKVAELKKMLNFLTQQF
jgi:hypothetical protein